MYVCGVVVLLPWHSDTDKVEHWDFFAHGAIQGRFRPSHKNTKRYESDARNDAIDGIAFVNMGDAWIRYMVRTQYSLQRMNDIILYLSYVQGFCHTFRIGGGGGGWPQKQKYPRWIFAISRESNFDELSHSSLSYDTINTFEPWWVIS